MTKTKSEAKHDANQFSPTSLTCTICRQPITRNSSYVYYGSDTYGRAAFAHRICMLSKSETDKPPSLYVSHDRTLEPFYYYGAVCILKSKQVLGLGRPTDTPTFRLHPSGIIENQDSDDE